MILAVDPGLSGGLAWTESGTISLAAMPDTEADVVNTLRRLAPARVVVEDIPWMVGGPRVNPASLSKLHRNCGVIHGALLALRVPTVTVRPSVWQARFGIAEKKYALRKRRLKAEAQRRYPALAEQITLDTADALLILDWALDHYDLT